jgi:hypothetical protein
LRRPKHHLGPGASVDVDWFGGLPIAQLQAFRTYANEFEAFYLMLSVSLNEAIGLRDSGALARSHEALALTSSLCSRLAEALEDILLSLGQHSKEHETTPSVAALNPTDFLGSRSHCAALKNVICHRALFSHGARFLSKIRTLRAMVTQISRDFCQAADGLASHDTVGDSSQSWAVMDAGHFDLNTCLRESMVLLKCFLRVLPDEQVRDFVNIASSRRMLRRTAPNNAVAVGGRSMPHRTSRHVAH